MGKLNFALGTYVLYVIDSHTRMNEDGISHYPVKHKHLPISVLREKLRHYPLPEVSALAGNDEELDAELDGLQISSLVHLHYNVLEKTEVAPTHAGQDVISSLRSGLRKGRREASAY